MFDAKQIQKIVGTEQDGIIGPKSRAAINRYITRNGHDVSVRAKQNQLKVVQIYLKQKGHYTGDIDGLWGPKSQAALVKYRPNTRKVNRIFVHCSATPQGRDVSPQRIVQMHTFSRNRGGRGWSRVGYHYVVTLDGQVHQLLDQSIPGIHARGFNRDSIAICYIGGMSADMKKAKDTRTPAQKHSIAKKVKQLSQKYPQAWIGGHRDVSPDKDGDGVIQKHQFIKQCPSFDVGSQIKDWLK